jgi:uncharacterized protein (TIGR03083 family)
MSSLAPATTTAWLSALRQSQQQLAALVEPMSDQEVEAPSYDTEWSIAQVLSHLGSGAEIFSLFVEAGLNGAPSPGAEAFQPIWAEWNAKSPQQQARDALRSDAAFLERLDALTDAQREGWQLEMFGSQQRLADVLRLRLGEHALHRWDVAVMLDDGATVDANAVGLVIDHLDQLVSRAGKAPEDPIDVVITTDGPNRSFGLTASDGAVALTPREPGSAGDARVKLPAEALLRLLYGRLDPDHTPPAVVAEGVDLDTLRRMFPGV